MVEQIGLVGRQEQIGASVGEDAWADAGSPSGSSGGPPERWRRASAECPRWLASPGTPDGPASVRTSVRGLDTLVTWWACPTTSSISIRW
jgi:hypothetical protein